LKLVRGVHEGSASGNLMHTLARLFGAVAPAAAVLATISCTDASTSVASPSASKCENTAINQPTSFPASGGRGAVTIGAGRECTWSVAADASWIVITSSRTGQGDAVVGYTVSENTVPAARTASLTVDSTRLPLSQAAATCTFAVSPTDLSIDAGGGSLSVGVSTLAGCAWTAVSHAAWIDLPRSAGDATTTITLTIAPNNAASREGTLTIAGRVVTVQQSGASGAPAPPPPSPTPTPTPSPTPTPTPPPPQDIEFEGLVSSLSGGCPNVSFAAAGRVVIANQSTDYRKGDCRDLSDGERVKVRGTTTTGSPVTATRIEFR
jgi:hypothetical protein